MVRLLLILLSGIPSIRNVFFSQNFIPFTGNFCCNFRSCPKLIAAIRSPGTKSTLAQKETQTWLHSESGAPATAWRGGKGVQWIWCVIPLLFWSFSELLQQIYNVRSEWWSHQKSWFISDFRSFVQTLATNEFLAKAAMFEFHDFQATSALRKQHMALYFLLTTDGHREPLFSSWWGKDQPNQRQMTVKLQGTFLGTRWMG